MNGSWRRKRIRAPPDTKAYELRMTGTLAGFFSGVVFAQGMASPTGIDGLQTPIDRWIAA
jgi:hypothetical protein